LRAQGASETHVRFGVALAPENHTKIQQNQAWRDDLIAFFERVNAEDKELVEGVFANLRARHAIPGPLSILEKNLQDFHRYLGRMIN
ncbi:MAG: SRPBCC family protein, partial [Pseudomonadota bacterium]